MQASLRAWSLTVLGFLALAAGAKVAAQTPAGPADAIPSPRAVATMSELMVRVIYPASDALFYIESRTPTTEEQWGQLEGTTLMLAESANLLMSPQRAADDQQWMRDSVLMLEAAAEAFEAVKKKDVDGILAVSDRLYESCTTCHQHYRGDYGRRP
jgi:hypothetical protein